MSHRTPSRGEVFDAALKLLHAFASGNTKRLYGAFAADAAIVNVTSRTPLSFDEAKRQIWDAWQHRGWRVMQSDSSGAIVQCFEGGAVFSHHVILLIRKSNGETFEQEHRETLVFRADNEQLVIVHQHVSALPTLAE